MKTSRVNLRSNLKHCPFLLPENYFRNVMNSKLRISIHEVNGDIKRCSTSIMIRETQNVPTVNCTSQHSEWPSVNSLHVTNAGEGAAKTPALLVGM